MVNDSILDNLFDLFQNYDGEFLEFDRIDNKLSNRRDLHAMLLMDSLFDKDDPRLSTHDILGGPYSDEEIIVNMDLEYLNNIITEELAIELIRCGFSINLDNESLTLFYCR